MKPISAFLFMLLVASVGCTHSSPSPSGGDEVAGTSSMPSPQEDATPSKEGMAVESNSEKREFESGNEQPIEPSVSKSTSELPRMPQPGPEAQKRLEYLRVQSDGSSIPDGFPDDVPVYPNAKVEASGRMAGDLTVTLKTSDSLDLAFAFYQNELERLDWTIESSSFSGRSLTALKSGRSCFVVVQADAYGGTLIGLTITEEKK